MKAKDKRLVEKCLSCPVPKPGYVCEYSGWYNDIQSDGTDEGWDGPSPTCPKLAEHEKQYLDRCAIGLER